MSALSDFGDAWQEMVDVTADWQVELLRRTAERMAHGLDRDAQRDIEGAIEWRNSKSERSHRDRS